MAVYKVIQDVEAEDKIVGPLSLKQLIFAGIAFGTIFIAFKIVTSTGVIYTAIPFLPVIFIFGFLAAPIGRDQPTEMWLAAQIRFFTKPRVRIWDQSDIKHLVNITVPRREEKIYTDGLNQTQVHSRLKALASTLDSRGWAVKNVDINMYGTAAYGQAVSDRLVDPSSLPVAVPAIDVKPSDDIMDVASNETAHHFDVLMQASSKAHKDAVIAKMHQNAEQKQTQTAEQEDYWFMHQTQQPIAEPNSVMFEQEVVQPIVNTVNDNNTFLNDHNQTSGDDLSAEEQKIIERAKKQKEQAQTNYSAHHKVVLTPEQQKALKEKQKQEKLEQERIAAEKAAEEQRKKAQEEKTHLSKADTIELANANLKVSTIAGLAKHKSEEKQDPNEVVVKLR